MTTYYVHDDTDRTAPTKFLLKTTSRKKAMKLCDESQFPVCVCKFIKWNYMTPVVHCNKAWEDAYLHTVQWADGFIALGDW